MTKKGGLIKTIYYPNWPTLCMREGLIASAHAGMPNAVHEVHKTS